MGKKLPVWAMPYAPRVGEAIQLFQGGEIWNEDWLFQPSKNPKSEPRIQDGSAETTYLRLSP